MAGTADARMSCHCTIKCSIYSFQVFGVYADAATLYEKLLKADRENEQARPVEGETLSASFRSCVLMRLRWKQ